MLHHDLGNGADLRWLETHHAPELLELISTHRDHFGAFLGWANTMKTVEEAKQFILRGLKRVADENPAMIGIWLKGQMVGGLLFFPVNQFSKSTEIGYWLAPTATGHGLMTRTVQVALEYCFAELKLNRVSIQAATDNLKSRAIPERLGFTLEGVLRQSWPHPSREGFVDNALYSLLCDEWLKKR
jgi:ribosomal-protein-serine acetyltransferase